MKRLTKAGYTILEVMIVMTVSGVLFISAALLLSSKQAETEASQSVRDFESQIQGVVSDVANGYYPTQSCAPAATGVNFPGTPAQPGASGGCIFLGNIVNFRQEDAIIIPVVGRQYVDGSTSKDVSTLFESFPTKVANLSSNYTNKYGLRVTQITSSSVVQYRALGFISQLGSTSGNPVTGSRSTLLYGLVGNVVGNGTTAFSLPVNAGSLVPLPNGVTVCMKVGNDKKAKITVGTSGNQTDTEVFIDGGVGSECP